MTTAAYRKKRETYEHGNRHRESEPVLSHHNYDDVCSELRTLHPDWSTSRVRQRALVEVWLKEPKWSI